MTINNVTIGDKFKNAGTICEVVDLINLISVKTGECIGHQCIAKGINTLSTNSFEVPFATVARNRIK